MDWIKGLLFTKEDTPTSRDALRILNGKEQKLKEDIMKLIIESKASDKEVIRCLAFLINSFKRVK